MGRNTQEQVDRINLATKQEFLSGPEMIGTGSPARIPQIGIYKVQSEATGQGVYNCYPQKLEDKEWDNTKDDDQFSDKTEVEIEVLNLHESQGDTGPLSPGDIIVAWTEMAIGASSGIVQIHRDSDGIVTAALFSVNGFQEHKRVSISGVENPSFNGNFIILEVHNPDPITEPDAPKTIKYEQDGEVETCTGVPPGDIVGLAQMNPSRRQIGLPLKPTSMCSAEIQTVNAADYTCKLREWDSFGRPACLVAWRGNHS